MGTSVYPGALDDFAEASPPFLADDDTTGRDHPARHDDLEAAMEAVQGEVGTDPAGGSATVKARLDGVDTSLASKLDASEYTAWTAFTPTYNNVTVGNGTNTGIYMRIGDLVFIQMELIFGSTTAFTGTVEIDYPVSPDNTPPNILGGSSTFEDTGAATYWGPVQAFGTFFVPRRANVTGVTIAASAVNATAPFTWTTNDKLRLNFYYRGA